MATNFGFSPVTTGRFYFISYNTEDSPRVGAIANELYKSGVPLWYDEGLVVGKEWESQIADSISKCEAVILFVTQGIFRKEHPYVRTEYKIAATRRKPIIPVFLDNIAGSSIPNEHVGWWVELNGLHGIRAVNSAPTAVVKLLRYKLGYDKGPMIPEGTADDGIPRPVPVRGGGLNKVTVLTLVGVIAVVILAIAALSGVFKPDDTTEGGGGTTTPISQEDSGDTDDPADTGTTTPAATEAPSLQSIHYVGETVNFGSYKQSGSSSEPIQWKVVDVEDGRALLVSVNALDCVRYNKTESNVTWSTCSLRSWLNNTFYDDAFSREEASKIVAVYNDTPRNDDYPEIDPGPTTYDYVFLLSAQEARQYFNTSERKLKPTKHAKENGLLVRDGICFWWLRTPGFEESNAVVVTENGEINTKGGDVDGHNIGVRPAIWINE